MGKQLEEVKLTPLKQISNPNGDIFHALKKSEDSFVDFGEAYFSFVEKGHTKGWKKHTLMTLNLVVPIGEIRFVLFNEYASNDAFQEYKIGADGMYARLTIPPGYYVAFTGLSEKNCLLNLANIEHDPKEAVNKPLEDIPYTWL
jgi:dTDP-4-dehydrorhamnose 3,5-epimerase